MDQGASPCVWSGGQEETGKEEEGRHKSRTHGRSLEAMIKGEEVLREMERVLLASPCHGKMSHTHLQIHTQTARERPGQIL